MQLVLTTGAFSKAQKGYSYSGLSVGLDMNAKRGDYTSFKDNLHQCQQDAPNRLLPWQLSQLI